MRTRTNRSLNPVESVCERLGEGDWGSTYLSNGWRKEPVQGEVDYQGLWDRGVACLGLESAGGEDERGPGDRKNQDGAGKARPWVQVDLGLTGTVDDSERLENWVHGKGYRVFAVVDAAGETEDVANTPWSGGTDTHGNTRGAREGVRERDDAHGATRSQANREGEAG